MNNEPEISDWIVLIYFLLWAAITGALGYLMASMAWRCFHP